VGSPSPVAVTSITIARSTSKKLGGGRGVFSPDRPCITGEFEEESVSEQTSHREDDEKEGSEPNDKDSGASSADRAKEREREMEEGGEENPA
jgi:hypothetical protein